MTSPACGCGDGSGDAARLVGGDGLGALAAFQRQDFRRQVGWLRLGEQAADQRAQDEEHQRQRGEEQGDDLADADEIELVEVERPGAAAAVERGVGAGEGGAFDGDDVAALFVEEDGRFHERGEAGDLFSGRGAYVAGCPSALGTRM